MSIRDRSVYFNMYEQLKQPHEDYSICDVNFVDGLLVDEHDGDGRARTDIRT